MKAGIALAALLACSPALAGAPSADAIAKDIAAHGAKAVVDRLDSKGDYERVLDLIDKGNTDYVALAPKLAPGADAGNAEALIISLAFALPNNPRAVLSILGGKDGFAVDDVCEAPFIEGTVPSVPAYVKSAKRALAQVSDQRLARIKAACIVQLDKALLP